MNASCKDCAPTSFMSRACSKGFTMTSRRRSARWCPTCLRSHPLRSDPAGSPGGAAQRSAQPGVVCPQTAVIAARRPAAGDLRPFSAGSAPTTGSGRRPCPDDPFGGRPQLPPRRSGRSRKRHARSLMKRLGIARPSVLFVGTVEAHKNLAGMLEAYARLPRELRKSHQLVLVCVVTRRTASGCRSWRARPGCPRTIMY